MLASAHGICCGGTGSDMSRNVRTVTVLPSVVWKVLADGWLYPIWVVGASRMREVEDRLARRSGAKLHHSVGIWPALINDNTEVLESQPDHVLQLRARGWPAGEAEVVIRALPPTERARRSPSTRTRWPAPASWSPRRSARPDAEVAQHRDLAPAVLHRREQACERAEERVVNATSGGSARRTRVAVHGAGPRPGTPMAASHPSTRVPRGMTNHHDEPIDIEGASPEEDISPADVADRAGLDPDEQRNREHVDEEDTPDPPEG